MPCHHPQRRLLRTVSASSCAVHNDAALCWGFNGYGQIGDNTTTTRTVPVQVTGLTAGVAGIAVGESYACAVTTGGSASCWGRNHSGRLGDGTDTHRLVPAPVPMPT